MLSGGLAKGRWAVLGMVTEGGDLSSWHHIFPEVTSACEKAQLLYAGCVHFTVDWLFWNLYGSYIAPRPLFSWQKARKFQFWQYGTFKAQYILLIGLIWPLSCICVTSVNILLSSICNTSSAFGVCGGPGGTVLGAPEETYRNRIEKSSSEWKQIQENLGWVQ